MAGAVLWVRAPNIPTTVAEKFLRESRGGFFQNHLAVGRIGWYVTLGALAEHPDDRCRKVFAGVKRGLFSKSPPFARLLWAFLFDSFFFLTTGGALDKPPLCKGRCRAERGGGVVPDINYLLFLFANSALLQSLRRSRASPLYTRGPLGLCGHPPGTSTDIKAKKQKPPFRWLLFSDYLYLRLRAASDFFFRFTLGFS